MGRSTFQRRKEKHEMNLNRFPPSASLFNGSPADRVADSDHDGIHLCMLLPWGGLALRGTD